MFLTRRNDQRPATGAGHTLLLAVLAISGTTFALLQAVVVPALPTIEHALRTTSNGGAWILTVNLLSTAVLTPILGRAGDIAGKHRVLTAVMAALALGTLVCAVAPSLPVMLLGRAIQGAGGASYPLAFGIVRDVLPRERIAGAIGLVSSLVGIGAGLGLVGPGLILAHLSYHWLFWLPLIVVAGITPVIARCVPPSPVRAAATVNLRSAAQMTAGLAGLLVAISQAPSWGWTSSRTLVVLAASVAMVIAWTRSELRSPEPLVDMRMMAARIERRIGSRRQLQAAMACMLLAYAVLVVAPGTVLEVLASMVVLGLGLGLGLSSLANLIVVAVDRRQTGVATAMNTVMRTLGGAFGAQLAATCIGASRHGGLPSDSGFTVTFGVCAVALAIGLLGARVVPRNGRAAAPSSAVVPAAANS